MSIPRRVPGSTNGIELNIIVHEECQDEEEGAESEKWKYGSALPPVDGRFGGWEQSDP